PRYLTASSMFNRVPNRPSGSYKAERISQKAVRSTGAGAVITVSTDLVFSVSGGTVSVL
ncbi:uncharacterized, partial [Tachysurus ichikawai]